MKVIWSKKALKNIEDAISYYEEIEPALATRFTNQIFQQIEQLKEFPASGKLGRVSTTRELVIADFPFLIPYKVKTKSREILILRVFHTRKNPPLRW